MELSSILANISATPIILLTICVLLGLYFVTGRKRTNIPGPKSLPVLGNVLDLLNIPKGGFHLYSQKLGTKYGEIVCIKTGSTYRVFLNSQRLINEAFTKQADIFSYRPIVKINNRKNMGIVWGNGPEWKQIRRFSLQTLRDFGVGKKTVEERILEEVANVLKFIEESNGEPINIKDAMTKAVSNTIHSVVFGFRYDYENEKFIQLLKGLDTLFSSPGALPFQLMPFLSYVIPSEIKNRKRRVAAQAMISDYITQQIAEHKETFDENNIRDFVDIYINAERNGSTNGLKAEWLFEAIRNLFNAGTDTTATSLQWAFLYLIKYPEVQKKCQDVIDKFVGNGRMVTSADRSNLTYIDATINEVQRLGNIAISSVPHCNIKDANLCGYHIPKDSVIFANIHYVHMNPANWEEPKKFRPERFISPEGKLVKRENFIPFGHGARVCPGDTLARTELFLMVSNALQRFTFSVADTDEQLNLDGILGVTLSPKPYKLRAHLR